MILDIPPQIELQIVEIAKQQNISTDDFVKLALQEKIARDNPLPEMDYEKLYDVLGFKPLTGGKHIVTNDYVNELREQYGI